MSKRKREWVPIETANFIDRILKQIENTSSGREPTRVQAWNIVTDALIRHDLNKQLFKKRKRLNL